MLGVRHAVGVSSGTDALLVALMALGVGPGDEVVTSPFSFFASAGVVARLNARPVFVDIEPGTFNMDPSKLEAAITPRTKAIQPVHLYGQCADMDPILEIAGRRGVPVARGRVPGDRRDVRGAGRRDAWARWARSPSTRRRTSAPPATRAPWRRPTTRLAALLKSLRLHGSSTTYHHDRVGGNFRLDAMQAAVLNVKLPRLAAWNERRRAIARRYAELLAEAARAERIVLPAEAPGRARTSTTSTSCAWPTATA